ncbi:alpha-methylacyl-CoA racemase-like [Babylonia areolata]|uniref:alpha-methylacyl-CoA racemase-like n=1 Tax=Babylonia areolata TaxID=304850 RepID=UPI003FD4A361
MALKGIRVVEMAGLAPAPFCGMILADFGARVIRVDRPNTADMDRLARGKQSVVVDLKKETGADVVRRLCGSADVLLEPYRPGIMEKMGLGPDILMKDNPGLVYARLTGFGQSGPLSKRAGHDINYIAISGLLSTLGRKGERPYPPINLMADFAGGGLLCALGIVMALFERHTSGLGQVIDVSMAQGSAYLGSWLWMSQNLPGLWGRPRGENLLDGGAAFYDVYETQDGKFMSVGCLEPKFFQDLLQGLNIDAAEVSQMDDQVAMRQKFQDVFKTRTQDQWSETFSKLDACVEPVLGREGAADHPHNRATHTFLPNPSTGKPEPAPAPRLSRTPGIDEVLPQPRFGQHTVSVLLEAGMVREEIDRLLKEGTVVDNGQQKAKL